jgi:hypothetical protein
MADTFSREREIAVRPFDGAIEALEILKANGSALVLLCCGYIAFRERILRLVG